MYDALTLVIPTYNRHHSLAQVLSYVSGFDARILVLDSTATPHVPSSKNARIDYVHCPEMGLLHKIKKYVVEQVETPYMLMNADDTFPSEHMLARCVDFLENNPDYSSALGAILYHNNGKVYSRVPDFHLFPVDSDNAGARLLEHFAHYHPMFYSVQRTDCWKTALQLRPENLLNYNLQEFYLALMQVAHGKAFKFRGFFHVANEVFSENIKNLSLRGRSDDMIFNSRYFPELEAIKRTVSRYLVEQRGLHAISARRYVEDALALLFIWGYRRKTFYWLGDRPPKTLKDRLKGEWNSWLRKTLRRCPPATDAPVEAKSDLELVLEQSSEPERQDFEAIMKILKEDGGLE